MERQDKVTWLQKRLKMTPLERIAWAYASNEPQETAKLLGFYETFLAQISKPEVRKELKKASDDSYENRYENPYYAELKANSDGFVAELLRFTLAQRGTWTDRFFEYLIY